MKLLVVVDAKIGFRSEIGGLDSNKQNQLQQYNNKCSKLMQQNNKHHIFYTLLVQSVL